MNDPIIVMDNPRLNERLIVLALKAICSSSRPTKIAVSKSAGNPYTAVAPLFSRLWSTWNVCFWARAAWPHGGGIDRFATAVLHWFFQFPMAVGVLFGRRPLSYSPSIWHVCWRILWRVRGLLELWTRLGRPLRTLWRWNPPGSFSQFLSALLEALLHSLFLALL